MTLCSPASSSHDTDSLPIVRAIVRQSIARGCQAYIIREGWEGLVRGNTSGPTPAPTAPQSPTLSASSKTVTFSSLPPSQQFDKLTSTLNKESLANEVSFSDPNEVTPLEDTPLSFGYGQLLRDGAGEGDVEELASHGMQGLAIADREDEKGRSLKNKYIVRVGWDDVRGWQGEGGTLIGSSRCPACKSYKSYFLFFVLTPKTQSAQGKADSKRLPTLSIPASTVSPSAVVTVP